MKLSVSSATCMRSDRLSLVSMGQTLVAGRVNSNLEPLACASMTILSFQKTSFIDWSSFFRGSRYFRMSCRRTQQQASARVDSPEGLMPLSLSRYIYLPSSMKAKDWLPSHLSQYYGDWMRLTCPARKQKMIYLLEVLLMAHSLMQLTNSEMYLSCLPLFLIRSQ